MFSRASTKWGLSAAQFGSVPAFSCYGSVLCSSPFGNGSRTVWRFSAFCSSLQKGGCSAFPNDGNGGKKCRLSCLTAPFKCGILDADISTKNFSNLRLKSTPKLNKDL